MKRLELVRILMFDESADFKHILMTVSNTMSQITDVSYNNCSVRKGISYEFLLVDRNPHVQARNIILMTILSSKYAVTDKSIIKGFTSILYNMHLDEESFSILASTLNRWNISNILTHVFMKIDAKIILQILFKSS